MSDENPHAEFLTNNENAALALYFCLKKDGIKARHFSFLHTTGQEGESVKSYHIHRVYAEISRDIMMTFVQYEADRFPSMFVLARWRVLSCPEQSAMLDKGRLLRPLQ